jgi:hypothetical protein
VRAAAPTPINLLIAAMPRSMAFSRNGDSMTGGAPFLTRQGADVNQGGFACLRRVDCLICIFSARRRINQLHKPASPKDWPQSILVSSLWY